MCTEEYKRRGRSTKEPGPNLDFLHGGVELAGDVLGDGGGHWLRRRGREGAGDVGRRRAPGPGQELQRVAQARAGGILFRRRRPLSWRQRQQQQQRRRRRSSEPRLLRRRSSPRRRRQLRLSGGERGRTGPDCRGVSYFIAGEDGICRGWGAESGGQRGRGERRRRRKREANGDLSDVRPIKCAISFMWWMHDMKRINRWVLNKIARVA